MLLLCHRNRISWYVLTREGIKPQPTKVEAILAPTATQNVRQLHRFLGMVQYFRDLWARQSKMLSPHTNLIGEWWAYQSYKGYQDKAYAVALG